MRNALFKVSNDVGGAFQTVIGKILQGPDTVAEYHTEKGLHEYVGNIRRKLKQVIVGPAPAWFEHLLFPRYGAWAV